MAFAVKRWWRKVLARFAAGTITRTRLVTKLTGTHRTGVPVDEDEKTEAAKAVDEDEVHLVQEAENQLQH